MVIEELVELLIIRNDEYLVADGRLVELQPIVLFAGVVATNELDTPEQVPVSLSEFRHTLGLLDVVA